MEGSQGLLIDHLLSDARRFRSHILRVLDRDCSLRRLFPNEAWNGAVSSSVMLLLGKQAEERGDRDTPGRGRSEICVILNKRSRQVRQGGDLCCPGGAVETQLDRYLAKLLSLPWSPLVRWPCWPRIRRRNPQEAKLLSLLLATSLRESWEEMRLNPLMVRFLGPLPAQRLLMFHRVIHPMVGWVVGQKRFVPSWEVEKIVPIPLRSLLNVNQYARFRLHVPPHLEEKLQRTTQDFPCFIHQRGNSTELLWGATYRIVLGFLQLALGFTPPDMSALPLVPGILSEGYVNGRS